MIRSLRAYFLTRALREKLLLLGFIGIGLVWWFSEFSTRAGGFLREQQITTSRLREQAEWIRNRERIEATAQATAARLEPAQTLNGNQLVAAVSQLARDSGLPNSQSSAPTTRRSGQFALHSVEFTIRNADYESVLKFYDALVARSPYIAIERFTLQAQPNNPAQLTLVLKVASIELDR